MKTRYGCLTLLALFTAWIAVTFWYSPPDDNGAVIPIGGLFALAVLYIVSGIEWLITRRKREQRGSPVVRKKEKD